MGKRVAVYVRVSTSRQAENDVSIPDQLRQAEAYCKDRKWEIVATYADPGASARDDKRPQFRRMIEECCKDPSPVDVVLVHSLSRFYRDAIEQGLYRRKLEKHGVLLKSVTQEFSEGADGELMQNILAVMDQHSSAENSKNVRSRMAENARQGFWNGSTPPLGYKAVEAERRGDKIKKKLAVDPKAAELVRLIFKLALKGDGTSGPMGVKDIASWLNSQGYRTRTDGYFYNSTVYDVLTRTAYIGTHYYNQKDSRTGKRRPREEWVPVSVPTIISVEDFETVQRRLKERSPKKIAPRLVKSPVLLSGIARCSHCRSNLMLGTGKNGKYRYYVCSAKALKGSCTCSKPTRIPEEKLNTTVLDALSDRVLEPERTRQLLREAFKRRSGQNKEAAENLRQLRKDKRQADQKIERLYTALTDGTVRDNANFRTQLNKLEAEQEEYIRLIAIRERELALPSRRLSNAQLDRVANGLRAMLKSGPVEFKREWLRLLVSHVDVGGQEIRIEGSKAALAAAIQSGADTAAPKVPSFVREWRTRHDSNVRPLPSEGSALSN